MMMLVACPNCLTPLANPLQRKGRTRYYSLFICESCKWYAEYDNERIVERDGSYGFKGTGR